MQVIKGPISKTNKQNNNSLETIVCNQINIYFHTLLLL